MKSMLFHATTPERAKAILRDGFIDGRGNYIAENGAVGRVAF
jgi:hypothetical protein